MQQQMHAAQCFLHDVQCRLLEIELLLRRVQHVSMRGGLLQRVMRGKLRCFVPGMHGQAAAECFLHDGREPSQWR